MGLCRTHSDFCMLEFKQRLCNFAAKLSPANIPSSFSLCCALSLVHIPEPKRCEHAKECIGSYTRSCVRAKGSMEIPGGSGHARGLSPFLALRRRSRFRTLESSGPGGAPGTARPSRDQPRWLRRDSCFWGDARTHRDGSNSSGAWQITPEHST